MSRSAYASVEVYPDAMTMGWKLPKRVDFEELHAIPSGWYLDSAASVPKAFQIAGGQACVIVQRSFFSEEFEQNSRSPSSARSSGSMAARSSKSGRSPKSSTGRSPDSSTGSNGSNDKSRMHVLLALPDWAVDLKRTRWLMRQSKRGRLDTSPPLPLCALYACRECPAFGLVVLEFSYPEGRELTKHLPVASLREAQLLGRDLFKLVFGNSPQLCFWGLLNASMIFMERSGRLCQLVPVSCLLTLLGVRATAAHIAHRGKSSRLAPELKAMLLDEAARADETILSGLASSDSYAIGHVMLQALLGKRAEYGDGRALMSLSSEAQDLMQKVLYEEPEWRLLAQGALQHRWLRDLPP